MMAGKKRCFFGQVLSGFMSQKGLKQHELAQLAGVRQPVIAWFIQCRRLPSISPTKEDKSVMVRLASALGLDKSQKKHLYTARLMVSKESPVWNPKILNLLPKTKSISAEEAEDLILKAVKKSGEGTLTGWARANNFLDVTVQKIHSFIKGKPVSLDVASSTRAVLPSFINKLPLTDREKATLTRFFFERLLDPDIVEVLTSES